MKVTKIICDCCGREIEGSIFKLVLYEQDRELEIFKTGNEYAPQKDICDSCKDKIAAYVERMGKEETKDEILKKDEAGDLHGNLEEEAAVDVPDRVHDEEADCTTEEGVGENGEKKPENTEYSVPGTVQTGGKGRKAVKSTKTVKETSTRKKAAVKKTPAKKTTGSSTVKLPVDCKEVIKTCAYKGILSGQEYCDYLNIVGHSRGCKPGACTCYKKI